MIDPAYVFLLRWMARSRANDYSIEITQVTTQRVLIFVFEQVEVVDLYAVDVGINRRLEKGDYVIREAVVGINV